MLATTQMTYYFSVHYIQLQSNCIDTGPLCIWSPALFLNPPPPTPPLFSTEPILHEASTSAEEYQCLNGFPFPPRLSLFGGALARGVFWPGKTCAALVKLCFYFLKRPLCTDCTAPFAAWISWKKSPLQFKHFELFHFV